MSLLVVGSVALDSIETPFGKVEEAIGGSATYFAASASHFTPVRVVGVVGDDYPMAKLEPLKRRDVDFAGLETAKGESFRWRGKYEADLNSAITLDTRLGVFAGFTPKIPDAFKSSDFVFLANIHPALQLAVLDQVEKPKLVACDTMNLWISTERETLIKLLGRVDLVSVNDGEARMLSGSPNLLVAARWILAQGPKCVLIKKGEHGAMMFTGASAFFAPAYMLEQIFDPTGAGDSFAGGFMGWVAKTGDLSPSNLRRAVIHGSAMGSFAVEKFSFDRLMEITQEDIRYRVGEFQTMVSLG